MVLLKIITLRSKTKSSLCISIVTESLYLYTFLGCGIQTLTHMMRILKLSWPTIFIYLMTILMIVILYNIVYAYIGRTWWRGGFKPEQHWIWLNGCSSQFKSKIPFYFVSHYLHLTGGCICTWSFFGSRHKKGPHDGVGAVLKRSIRQVQFDIVGPQLQNAQKMVILFHGHLSHWPETSYSGE